MNGALSVTPAHRTQERGENFPNALLDCITRRKRSLAWAVVMDAP